MKVEEWGGVGGVIQESGEKGKRKGKETKNRESGRKVNAEREREKVKRLDDLFIPVTGSSRGKTGSPRREEGYVGGRVRVIKM